MVAGSISSNFDIDHPKRYKDAYRATLDALPMDAAQRDEALKAADAFALNAEFFDQLSAEFPRRKPVPQS